MCTFIRTAHSAGSGRGAPSGNDELPDDDDDGGDGGGDDDDDDGDDIHVLL